MGNDDIYFKEKAELVEKLIKNFPLLVWKVGLTEVMTQFVELCGEKYADKNVIAFREMKLFSENTINLLIDFEKVLLGQLENKYPFWIALTLSELQTIENARQLIIEELEIDNNQVKSVVF